MQYTLSKLQIAAICSSKSGLSDGALLESLLCVLLVRCGCIPFLSWRLTIIKGLDKSDLPHYEGIEAILAICIANLSHLLSVLVLFSLTFAVFPGSTTKFAFSAAALHIISPAGIFLSAPYAESSCALFSFAGCLAFAKSFPSERRATAVKHDFLLVVSGVFLGISTTLRSNGILSGLLLLEEAFMVLFSLKDDLQLARIRRLIASGVGGLSVGAGFLLPQYIAYNTFCTEQGVETLRPWCTNTVPSIYTFVQDYYWYVSCLPLDDYHLTLLGTVDCSGIGDSRICHFSCWLRQCL